MICCSIAIITKLSSGKSLCRACLGYPELTAETEPASFTSGFEPVPASAASACSTCSLISKNGELGRETGNGVDWDESHDESHD
jgi:hypothetical protein